MEFLVNDIFYCHLGQVFVNDISCHSEQILTAMVKSTKMNNHPSHPIIEKKVLKNVYICSISNCSVS